MIPDNRMEYIGSSLIGLSILQVRILKLDSYKLIEDLPPNFAKSYSVELVMKDVWYFVYRLYPTADRGNYLIIHLPTEKGRMFDPPIRISIAGRVPAEFTDHAVAALIGLYIEANNQ